MSLLEGNRYFLKFHFIIDLEPNDDVFLLAAAAVAIVVVGKNNKFWLSVGFRLGPRSSDKYKVCHTTGITGSSNLQNHV